jgi:uncharacterized membrane protein YjgN (DUF898 family)
MSLPARRPAFHGEGSTLFGIFIVNLLLTVLTLGIYSFWARTKVRRYLWSAVAFEGDRFAYHGTGKELLIGWLKAMAAFAVVYVGFFVLVQLGEGGALLAVLYFYGAVLVLVPLAILGARRYRLSRTSWRGVRFSQRGDLWGFVRLWIGGAILTGITLSLYRPYFETRTRAALWNDTWFGSAQFRFDGEGRDLFGRYVLALLLTIPTLGLYWFWYLAYRHRYFWAHTGLGEARFESTVTGGGLLGLTLTNLLLVALTLGLGTPWALVRLWRYHTDNLALVGEVDFAAILQQRGPEAGTAEGLADVLDVGGFDLGM